MQPPAGSQVSRVPAQRTPPEQLAPPPAAPQPARPPRRLRTVLTVVAGVLALLCVGGVVAGFVLYHRATTPDRSAPDVVVANYIQAYLGDRNDTKAQGFVCDGRTELDGLRELRDDLVAREEKFNTTISVRWGPLNAQQSGDDAVVEVDLIISAMVDGVSQSDRQSWRFETRQQDGWAVCGAQRAG
ncbi:hypothetical protein K7640_26890 [Micromonospora sp. PLK6-60]|uniref:hypothetical protein n=1 Tax=Micromonospora sp. PLK6-60 TaxID=2873383 RepID=UPI001CA60FE1|nr:hypothetical protein [Micromonospora sp. PLK6-60]MBY8875468.1 hypothetical protein [Micromonospora sp. PLK6-60]